MVLIMTEQFIHCNNMQQKNKLNHRLGHHIWFYLHFHEIIKVARQRFTLHEPEYN